MGVWNEEIDDRVLGCHIRQRECKEALSVTNLIEVFISWSIDGSEYRILLKNFTAHWNTRRIHLCWKERNLMDAI